MPAQDRPQERLRQMPIHCGRLTDKERPRGARRPSFDRDIRPKRARGMPGARCTRSLARELVVKSAHEYSQRGHRINPAFPHAMVLTRMTCSPATNSSCLRRLRICFACARLDRPKLRRLDTSNGCQHHTLLPYEAAPFVLRALITHGKLPCDPSTRPTQPASTASRPAFVTIAIRPFQWDETE
jgi:hypothetical protein